MKNRILRPWLLVVLATILIGGGAYIGFTGCVPAWLKAYQPQPHNLNQSQPHNLIWILVSLAGWLLTLAGLLFAGENAKRGLTFNAVSKLHDDEGAFEQAEAKQLVWQAAPPKNTDNDYSYIRQYISELPSDRRESLDRARRQLTSFWYKAARLVELGVLTPNDIFRSVGPPDIVAILEPLEAIHAEDINPNWKPRPWPPMSLLITWYKQERRGKEGRQLRPKVPARLKLYKLYKQGRSQ